MVTMDEALRIKAEMEQQWLALPGVTGVDVGSRTVQGHQTGDPVIRVYVTNRHDALTRLKLPESIRSVPVEIIERRYELH